ncbi:MAG: ABC transporter ATP-binding protein [Phyllobacterium sp.]
MTAPFLKIEGVRKTFGTVTVVRDFNLDVSRGEFVSFLGPSGCGKTTMLRVVAGFEAPSDGRVSIDGKDVTSLKPNQRNIGMVFQAYALFPNLTVAQNIGFGLKVAGVSKAETAHRVEEMMKIIGLPDFGGRYPYQLSGGQQQRVALARALAPKPQVLLLDEPLSALDAKIRISLREQIREIQKELGITTIFVTHDQEEALSMSDRIVVMHDGVAEQVGTPFEIYNRPASRFVASFVGTLNMLEATVADPVRGIVDLDGNTLRIDHSLNGKAKGDPVSLAVRPEAIIFGGSKGHSENVEGTITDVSFLGSVIRIRVALGNNSISLDTFNDPASPPPARDEKVKLSFAARDLLVLGD